MIHHGVLRKHGKVGLPLLPGLIYHLTTDEVFTPATKRAIKTFDLGDLTTEVTFGYNATLTAAGQYGSSVMTLGQTLANDSVVFGLNHGNGANDNKLNNAYYSMGYSSYEVYVAPDHDSGSFITGSPRIYLCRCKAGGDIDVYFNGSYIFTYVNPFQQDWTPYTKTVFIGGFSGGNVNTNCSGTLHKAIVVNRAILDSEIASAFALLA